MANKALNTRQKMMIRAEPARKAMKSRDRGALSAALEGKPGAKSLKAGWLLRECLPKRSGSKK